MPGDKSEKLSDRELILKMNKDLQTLLPMEAKMNKILQLVQAQNEKIERLEKQLEEQRQENTELRGDLKNARDDVDDLQQRSRINNIIINGIPEAKGEDVYRLVENIGDKLGISNPASHVQVAHRVKTTTTGKAKPIVVRMLNSRTRDLWTAAFRQKQLWKQKIFVSEHLTKKNQDLLAKTKALKLQHQYQFVWVKDCKIFVRQSEKSRVFVVRRECDLQRIFQKKEDVNDTSNF